MSRQAHDGVVVGAGPNGLAAAIVLARAGRSVLVREGASTPGGAVRSEALTLPGFIHDTCSAVYPLGIASPLFRRLTALNLAGSDVAAERLGELRQGFRGHLGGG